MDITPIVSRENKIITAYGAGGFSLNQQRHDGSLFIVGGLALLWNEQINFEALNVFLSQCDVELLLIGTGKNMAPIAPDLRAALKAKHIAVDAMDTGAACRTYNVLVTEERRVAAAIIAI